jgi:hypothetical protein
MTDSQRPLFSVIAGIGMMIATAVCNLAQGSNREPALVTSKATVGTSTGLEGQTTSAEAQSTAWVSDRVVPSGEEALTPPMIRLKNTLIQDQKNFYSKDNLLKLTLGFGVAAVAANTEMDQRIRNWYQDNERSSGTDSFAKWVKPLGNGLYTIPVYIGAMVVDDLTGDSPVGSALNDWGQHSMRATIVGAPPLIVLQSLLGGGRPSEEGDSRWKPFKDSHGVSGHAYMSAIPFLVAADMSTSYAVKIPLYVGSTLTGWSRINDNAHYTSQVVLGWWLAYLAVQSTGSAEQKERSIQVRPIFDSDTVGVELVRTF